MIITLKDEKMVYIAIDAGNTYNDIHYEDILHEENLKMWRVPETTDCIMASNAAGSMEINQIRYQPLSVAPIIDEKNIMADIIEVLKKVYKDCETSTEDIKRHTFILAKGDKAFEILDGCFCMEIEDFNVCGYGDDVAYGAMSIYQNSSPIERILASFRTVKKMKHIDTFPVVIMNTRTQNRYVFYE